MVSKFILGALSAGALLGSIAKVWTATLTGSSGLSGSAQVEAVGSDSVSATVNVAGAKANSSLGWGIHDGKCAAPGPMRGEYPAIMTDSTGTGSAMARVALKMQGEQSVVVHGEGGTTAGCGDLKPAGD